MSDYRSFIDNFDPRITGDDISPAMPDGAADAESDESTSVTSSSASPSPESEGGDGDFDVFNFDEARRRKLAKDAEVRARRRQAESRQEMVERMARSNPPARPKADRRPPSDGATERAADLTERLSGYSLPSAAEAATVSRAERERKAQRSDPGAGRSTGRAASYGSVSSSSYGRKSGSSSKRRKSKKRKITLLETVLKVIVTAGCVMMVLMIVYYSMFNVVLSEINTIELVEREDTPAAEVADVEMMTGGGVTNILLLGIDDDGTAGSRSDTIIIASLDTRNNTIKLCSILRDCYVEIPDYAHNRINAAYARGGAQLAVHTVESNFRVEIDHCAVIDMAAMIDLVDAVGGVEIELSYEEARQININSQSPKTASSGLQLLDGRQAVAYARIRKIDSDFARTQRQRTLINAILAKVKSLGVSQMLDVIEIMAPEVSTDLSGTQIASLALKALPSLGNEIEQMSIPAEGMYSYATINGMSVLQLNMEANIELLHGYLYGEEANE